MDNYDIYNDFNLSDYDVTEDMLEKYEQILSQYDFDVDDYRSWSGLLD